VIDRPGTSVSFFLLPKPIAEATHSTKSGCGRGLDQAFPGSMKYGGTGFMPALKRLPKLPRDLRVYLQKPAGPEEGFVEPLLEIFDAALSPPTDKPPPPRISPWAPNPFMQSPSVREPQNPFLRARAPYLKAFKQRPLFDMDMLNNAKMFSENEKFRYSLEPKPYLRLLPTSSLLVFPPS